LGERVRQAFAANQEGNQSGTSMTPMIEHHSLLPILCWLTGAPLACGFHLVVLCPEGFA
jgi:hypothetical protein